MKEIEELKKEVEVLKIMVAMQAATLEIMKNFHEAEKAMLIHAKKMQESGYTGNDLKKPDGVVHRGHCFNIKTGEVDSLKDFLKDGKIDKTGD